MKNKGEYDSLQKKLEYLHSRMSDLAESEDSVFHQMIFLREEMDTIRRRILEIETYDFYFHMREIET